MDLELGRWISQALFRCTEVAEKINPGMSHSVMMSLPLFDTVAELIRLFRQVSPLATHSEPLDLLDQKTGDLIGLTVFVSFTLIHTTHISLLNLRWPHSTPMHCTSLSVSGVLDHCGFGCMQFYVHLKSSSQATL